MARLDTTAVWYERGEDPQQLAEVPLANGSEPRHMSTMAWVGLGVALVASLFFAVLLHIAHTTKIVEAPLVIPASGTAATAPAAAPATQVPTPPAPPVVAAAQPAPSVSAPVAKPVTESRAKPAPARVDNSSSARGEQLLKRGRAGAALAAFQQTLVNDPDDVRALRGACVSLGKLGRMNDGARVCRRALDRAPEDVETRRALATIYYNGGAYKWAATEWRRVVEAAPKDKRARRALQRAEARAGRG